MIQIQAPASTANLGSGFDTMGLALNFFNTLSLEENSKDQVLNSADSPIPLPEEILKNAQNSLPIRCLNAYFKKINEKRPSFKVTLKTEIPLARGLGSSASVIVASLIAANTYCENTLSSEQVYRLAVDLEGHPDNVAPAMFGRFQFCDGYERFSLDWPGNWGLALFIPQTQSSTTEARTVLAQDYPLSDAIFNLRKSGRFIYAVSQQDPGALSGALEDRLHQPYRCPLLAHYSQIAELKEEDGIYGVVLSGSGPSVLLIYNKAQEQELLSRFQVLAEETSTELKCLQPNLTGAQQVLVEQSLV